MKANEHSIVKTCTKHQNAGDSMFTMFLRLTPPSIVVLMNRIPQKCHGIVITLESTKVF